MKKLMIASAIALATTAVSAAEFGVTGTRSYAGSDRNGWGITLSEKVAGLNMQASVQRFTAGKVDQDRYSLTVAHPLAKVGPVTAGLRVGGSYLDNQTGSDGFAAHAGVGFSMPITKTMSLNLDAVRQVGQDRVRAHNGNLVTAGVSVKF